jgi:hypothetical protein
MRTLTVALLIVSACGGYSGSDPPQTIPAVPTPIVTGRVVLSGNPVSLFVVALTGDLRWQGRWGKLTPNRSSDGRFQVSATNDGCGDIVIAGPGFATRLLHHVCLFNGPHNDLGDIPVSRGHTIEGTVRDDLGHPVANPSLPT